MTLDSSFLKKLIKTLNERDLGNHNPFKAILVSPLFTSKSTLQIIKKFKDEIGSIIYFDSGGYYVQQGKIKFYDLYSRLYKFYTDKENKWADWYVLPDNPPTSTDTPDIVEIKVRDTITASKTFYEKLPSDIQERSIPVIHGHTFDQINLCLEIYNDFNYIGFGSFSTSGENNCINTVSYNSARLVSYTAQNLFRKNKHLHIFGVSTPPVIYIFHRMGVYSFDSIGWLRSAGYGKVFLPFIRAYNVTHHKMRNSSLTRDEFEHLKEITNHECPFCEDFRKLQNSRIFRALHNLMVMVDTIELATHKDSKEILDIISKTSNRYFKMLREVTPW